MVERRMPVGVERPPRRLIAAAAVAAGPVAVPLPAEASEEGLAVKPGVVPVAGPVAELVAEVVAAVTAEIVWLPPVSAAVVTELAEPGGPGPTLVGRHRPPARRAVRRWRHLLLPPVLLRRRLLPVPASLR